MDDDISFTTTAGMTLMMSRKAIDVDVPIQPLSSDVDKVITAMAIQRDFMRRGAVR